MEKVKVGINGFGRIGRVFFRAAFDQVEIVGINSLSSAEESAHLLKYDSSHGKYDKDVSFDEKSVIVDGKKVNCSQHRNPREIPWKEWGADVVLECSGIFKTQAELNWHIEAGAKKVLVSAPAPGVDITVVYGINHDQYDPKIHNIVSNASCTTNCLSPLAKVLDEEFGIERGFMTTIHSYTNDQRILDTPHSDPRRARAAALSMIPTTTGAAKAVAQVLPSLKGKIDGLAIRVPTPNVSLVDFVVETKKSLTVEAVNSALIKSSEGELKGVLRCEEKPLVSVDFMGDQSSSIVDLLSTMVLGDNMVKVFSWYDNEMGFSSRMVDLSILMAKKGW